MSFAPLENHDELLQAQEQRELVVSAGTEGSERCSTCLAGPHAGAIEPECIPVPWFGKMSECLAVATVGPNPALTEWRSNRDWHPREQRLPILRDLGLAVRSQMTDGHLEDVKSRRAAYFSNKPHSYFDALESLLRCIDSAWSYKAGTAIHLDLVACATRQRWARMSHEAKAALKKNCRNHLIQTLGLLPSRAVLLLNGESVHDGLLEAVTSPGSIPPPDTCEIPGASGTSGFAGRIKAGNASLGYVGWSTPIDKTTGPTALATALWVRQMAKALSADSKPGA